MNKVAALAVIALCLILAGTVLAVSQCEKVSTSSGQQILVDRNGDTKIDGVDIYDETGKVVKRGYDVDGDMVVNSWETYDENTGMPIVTESDEAFELR